MTDTIRGIVLPLPTVFLDDRRVDLKMYPRCPSKPLSPQAHDELGNLSNNR